jgi:hypothetical protein
MVSILNVHRYQRFFIQGFTWGWGSCSQIWPHAPLAWLGLGGLHLYVHKNQVPITPLIPSRWYPSLTYTDTRGFFIQGFTWGWGSCSQIWPHAPLAWLGLGGLHLYVHKNQVPIAPLIPSRWYPSLTYTDTRGFGQCSGCVKHWM